MSELHHLVRRDIAKGMEIPLGLGMPAIPQSAR